MSTPHRSPQELPPIAEMEDESGEGHDGEGREEHRWRGEGSSDDDELGHSSPGTAIRARCAGDGARRQGGRGRPSPPTFPLRSPRGGATRKEEDPEECCSPYVVSAVLFLEGKKYILLPHTVDGRRVRLGWAHNPSIQVVVLVDRTSLYAKDVLKYLRAYAEGYKMKFRHTHCVRVQPSPPRLEEKTDGDINRGRLPAFYFRGVFIIRCASHPAR